MIRKLDKLKARADFVRLTAARGRAAEPGLVLQSAPQPEELRRSASRIRVGFTASRKIGNAVTRNRAKRKLREAARAVLPRRGKSGTDYVLIARDGTAARPLPALVADLEASLRRIETAPRRRRGGRAQGG